MSPALPHVGPGKPVQCVLCGRRRDVDGSNTTTWSGIFHGRFRNGWGEDQIFYDWFCWECIRDKSVLEYFDAIYGADHIRIMIPDLEQK